MQLPKELIPMDILVVFRWISSSSLTVLKASATIGIIVVLTSHNFCTCNLKFWYLETFSNSFTLMFYSSGTAMPMILHPHSIWSLVFYFFICLDCKVPKYVTFVVFQHWIWLMREPFIFTFNLFQSDSISCTGVSVLFFQVCRVSSCIVFQLWQSMNWQYGWHFQFSLCRAGIARRRPGDLCHFYCISSRCLFLGNTCRAFSFPFQLTCFQSLPPPLILRSLCFFSGIDHAMVSLSMLPVFHSLVCLYSSHQSLFLVLTLQLQPLEVSRCFLQHNQKG